MAKANQTWTVLGHRPLEKLNDRVWRVEGDLPGMPLKRVMTVGKRADGSLVVHNAIALEDAAMREIDAFGPVQVLIVPNGYHRLDAKVFLDRYPEAKVFCPRGASEKVAQVVPVSGAYEDFPVDADVSLRTLAGTGANEGVMIVRCGDDVTLVFNDAVFNMPHLSGFQGFMLKHVTASTGGPRISRVAKMLVIKDKAAFKKDLEQLAETEGLARIIVSHHETIAHEPARTLREVAATLG